MRGPSIPAPLEYGRVVDTGWDRRMGGCESGFTFRIQPIRTLSGPVATATKLTRWDARTKRARS